MDDAAESKKGSARELGIRAAKGTLIYTVGNIVGSLAILLLLIILARMLNAEEFSFYAIAIAFYNILAGHFVFGTAIRKKIPEAIGKKERVSDIISNGYAVSMLLSIAVALVAMALSNFIATSIYHNPAITMQLMLASATVVLYALFNLTLATLIAIDKAKEGTIIYLLYAFIQLFAAVALVLLGYGVVGAIAGMAVGLIIPSIIGIFIISGFVDNRFTMPSWRRAKELVDFSAPVLASNVALFVPANLAIMMLGVYATPLIVGNYNAAFRFGSFVSVVLVSISFVLLPAFSKAFSDKDMSSKIGKIYNSSIYYTLLLLLPLLVYAVSVSQPLMYALFSSKYTLAPFYFAVIAIGSAIGIVGTYASNLQVGYGDTRKFMYYQLLAVAIQVVLLFALTPTLGANGVLLALFVISQILIGIIYVHALYRQFSFKHETGRVIRLVVPSAILLVALYLLTLSLHSSALALVTNLIAVVALFPPIAAAFGGIRRENIEFIREIGETLKIQKPLNYILDYAAFFVSGKGIKANPSN